MEDLQRLLLHDRGLSVLTLPEKGRCLITTRDFSYALVIYMIICIIRIQNLCKFRPAFRSVRLQYGVDYYPHRWMLINLFLIIYVIGETILSEEPYVSVPNKTPVQSRCDWCFTSSNVKRCSSCQVVWYCGSRCQKSDWKLHRLECQLLARLEKSRIRSLTPSIRLMVKLYLRRKLQDEKVIPTTVIDNYNLVKALISRILAYLLYCYVFPFILSLQNMFILKQPYLIYTNFLDHVYADISEVGETQLVLYAQMASLVNIILQWPGLNIKEIAENFSKAQSYNNQLEEACSIMKQLQTRNTILPIIIKLACNAHTICDSELIPLGTGLYPVISIINHSCSPNSVLVFEGRMATVRAMQRIPKGSEVLISYIETAGSTMTRQKALKEQYFFTCCCPRCIKLGQHDDIEESAVLEGYRCKNHTCYGFLLRDPESNGFKCQQCQLVRDKEEILKIAGEEKAMTEKASVALSSGHTNEALHMYLMVEKLQVKLCHSFSINLMRTRETLLKILMDLQDWKKALTYCRLTIPVYERVYPRFHPLRGLQYYTCGKLEWLLGYTKEAIKSLTQAVDILCITHGTTSLFMKDLIIKLEEARAEASFKLSSTDD
ncbi:SET domain-containing protein [Cynara cardunculus var. scolymus]|uniref:SET domain-containing protein n=1 Tax=Cynara cardunculus var. scolymus TaxID=59895 RepID=A0A103XBX9_CYNCS|nr:SET domain-containing protein [Cynara cardunculus var. scolymus]